MDVILLEKEIFANSWKFLLSKERSKTKRASFFFDGHVPTWHFRQKRRRLVLFY